MVELLIITLYLVICVGVGVLLGWVLWGNDMKYYKYLYEHHKTKYNSPEEEKEIFQKQVKDALDKYMEDRYGERFHKECNEKTKTMKEQNLAEEFRKTIDNMSR